jgi:hypothetical protein
MRVAYLKDCSSVSESERGGAVSEPLGAAAMLRSERERKLRGIGRAF